MNFDITRPISEAEHDARIASEFGGKDFPVLYIGRGSYSNYLHVYSLITGTQRDDVHFFQIGKYSSIGVNDTVLINMNHDHDAVFQGIIPEYKDTSSLSIRESLGQSERTLKQKGMVLIGNDVWIGSNVTIIANVVIGNGAVIGANSVVTRDVPPYAVCVGAPARIVRYRFPEDIIRGLEKICWWDFPVEKLMAAKESMMGDVENFVKKYEPLATYYDYKGTFLPTLSKGKVPIIILFLDMLSDYPVYPRVLEQFASEFSDKSAELVLVYHPTDQEENTFAAIAPTLEKLSSDALISVISADIEDEEAIISEADCLFMSRNIRNIVRTNYAFKYGVLCLSSVDKPLFNDRLKKKIFERFQNKNS